MNWIRRPDEPPFPRGYRPVPSGPVRRPQPATRTSMNPLAAAALVLGLLAFMWLLELYDQANHNVLDSYGIHARDLDGLPEIFTAPLLHAGFPHLIGNSLPFAVLGFLTALGGFIRWLGATLVSVVASGLTAWLLTPANTIVLGASGLIMGWLTYVITRGFFDRRPGQIVLGIVVLLFYGGLIWGVLPTQSGVSWQAHLGGAIGGVIAARWLHGRRNRR
jgi:membrane associated rhomboid family serine protease